MCCFGWNMYTSDGTAYKIIILIFGNNISFFGRVVDSFLYCLTRYVLQTYIKCMKYLIYNYIPESRSHKKIM